MSVAQRGLVYLRSAVGIALGAGAVVGGGYLVSRVRERQDLETRLARMEKLLEELSAAEAEQAKPAPRTKPRAKPAAKK